MNETTYTGIEEILQAYCHFIYSCGLYTIQKAGVPYNSFAGIISDEFTRFMADGFIVAKYIPGEGIWDPVILAKFGKEDFPLGKDAVSLDEIKTYIINKLQS